MEDNTEYDAAVKGLESEDGLNISDSDLKPGLAVIWNYRGLPYKARLLEIYGKWMHVHAL